MKKTNEQQFNHSSSSLLPLSSRQVRNASHKISPVRLDCSKSEDRTKQSFKDECDINIIMKRFERTGTLNWVNRHSPQYGDVSGLEFQTAMDIVAAGKSAFAALPARIRDRFRNDPAQFLDFVQNPANAAEAAELGLLSPEGEQAVQAAQSAANAPAEPAKATAPAVPAAAPAKP